MPPLTLTVTLEQAQLLIDALTDRPYRQVAGLVPDLVCQVNGQLVARQAEQAKEPQLPSAAGDPETLQ